MSDTRRCYRVDLSNRGFLRATCKLGSEPPVPVRVVDASAGGVRLRFPERIHAEQVPELGGSVELRFQFGRATTPVLVSAKAVHEHEVLEGREFGFLIEAPDSFYSALPRAARPYFGLRQATRSTIEQSRLCPVTLTLPEGESLTGGLIDVSVLGIGFWVADPRPEALVEGAKARATFELPSEQGSFDVPGLLRYRRPIGDRVELGLAFTWGESSAKSSERNAIQAFVEWSGAQAV